MLHPSEIIQVSSKEELSQKVSMYLSQGFQIMVQSPTSVSLIKRKEFEMKWAVLGFLLCTIPLFIYLIYYANQNDRVVEIRLVSPGPVGTYTPESSSPASTEAAAAPGGSTAPPQLSPDGTHWWDGTQWHRVSS
jgi:hypothetical protein